MEASKHIIFIYPYPDITIGEKLKHRDICFTSQMAIYFKHKYCLQINYCIVMILQLTGPFIKIVSLVCDLCDLCKLFLGISLIKMVSLVWNLYNLCKLYWELALGVVTGHCN